MHDLDRTTAEFEPEQEGYDSEDAGFEFEDMEENYEDYEGGLDETLEMELAAELLEITDEAELDQFIGKLFKKVVGGVKRFARSPIGRALGGVLKKVGKVALPLAGKALGGVFGGPAGAMLGGKLGSMATRLFEVEMEGMSYEDQEFEIARRYVRLAADAARKAARMRYSNPMQAAQTAILAAARKYAPGIPRRSLSNEYHYGRRSGRWVRRGRKIILYEA